MTQPPPGGPNQAPPPHPTNQPPPGQRPPAQPGPPGAYPQQYPPQPYPPQQYPPQGYPPQGYPPQGYGPAGGLPPQGGYPPQAAFGPGGYRPTGAPIPPPRTPGKKSPVTLILIVVAAVVLLAAVGGIAMLLSRDNGTQPVTTITPSQPTVPTEDPTPSPEPSTPTTEPSQPTGPSTDPTPAPGGSAIDLGHGIQVTPAPGWEVGKTGNGVVQLSDGKNLFLGQAIQAEPTTNPGQLCESWHKQVAEGSSGGKFADPKNVDLGTKKLKGATCVAQTTISNGQGSATVLLFSLVSVRPADGVTVLGTILFTEEANTDQLNKDFIDMVNSMLKTQS